MWASILVLLRSLTCVYLCMLKGKKTKHQSLTKNVPGVYTHAGRERSLSLSLRSFQMVRDGRFHSGPHKRLDRDESNVRFFIMSSQLLFSFYWWTHPNDFYLLLKPEVLSSIYISQNWSTSRFIVCGFFFKLTISGFFPFFYSVCNRGKKTSSFWSTRWVKLQMQQFFFYCIRFHNKRQHWQQNVVEKV